MVSAWGYSINQWKLGQRVGLLLTLLLVIWLSWYVVLYRPLTVKRQTLLMQQTKLQTVSQELVLFQRLSNNFVYQQDVKMVQVQEIVQQALAEAPGVTVKTVVNDPPSVLPSMAQQFSSIAALFHLVWQPAVQQFPMTVTYIGSYEAFLRYLKVLQMRHVPLYFVGVDFNMERYPMATITMQVFTLGV